MSCSKAVVRLGASGGSCPDIIINPLNLSQFSGRYDVQSPLRFEQLVMDIAVLLGLNGASQTGAALQMLNPDGSVHFSGTVTQSATTGGRTKMT
jgi:hypothetical protein